MNKKINIKMNGKNMTTEEFNDFKRKMAFATSRKTSYRHSQISMEVNQMRREIMKGCKKCNGEGTLLVTTKTIKDVQVNVFVIV